MTQTYATLLADIQSWTDNNATEFVAQIPAMIERAQARVQRDLELAIWRENILMSCDKGSFTKSRHPSALKVYSIVNMATRRPMSKRSMEWCETYSQAGGNPRYWCEVDEDTWGFAPVPLNNDTIRVMALMRQEPLSETLTQNWFSENVPELLLWSALIDAESYLLSPQRVAEYQVFYDRDLKSHRAEYRRQGNNEYTPMRVTPVAGGAN